jgi:poly(A) polymerase
MMKASEDAIAAQAVRSAIPRRFSAVTRQICIMQTRFKRTRGKRWKRLLHEQRFRAGYDFLLLRATEDPSLEPLCEFWTEAQVGFEFPQPRGRSNEGGRARPRRRHRRRVPIAG